MLPHSEVQKLLWRVASPESQAWWNKGTLLSFPSCTSSTTIKTIRAVELTLNHTENVEIEVCVGVRVEKNMFLRHSGAQKRFEQIVSPWFQAADCRCSDRGSLNLPPCTLSGEDNGIQLKLMSINFTH